MFDSVSNKAMSEDLLDVAVDEVRLNVVSRDDSLGLIDIGRRGLWLNIVSSSKYSVLFNEVVSIYTESSDNLD